MILSELNNIIVLTGSTKMKAKIKKNSKTVKTILEPELPEKPTQPWWKRKAYELFGTDFRSLALLRVGVGALLLADLISRAQDLVAHYTDSGILPRQALFELASNPWHISLHSLSGQWQVEALLFIVAAVFALFLIAGYKTRFSTIISFVLLISLQNRDPIILHNSDTLIRVTLFWAMFLPWGKTFSVDSALHPHENPDDETATISLATVGYLAQIMFLYIFATQFKTSPDWRGDGTAIYYALSDEAFTTSLGYIMLQFPMLMKLTTHAVFWLEVIGPWLLIIPFGTTFFRSAAVLAFAAMHTGIGLTMHLGLFPWTSAIVALGLLPSGFWNFLQRFRKPKQPLTIYYDSECGFCQNGAHLMKTFLLLDQAEITSAINHPNILKEMVERNSWVIEDGAGQLHFKFEGFLALLARSPIFWPLSTLFDNSFVRSVGTTIYNYVATHRTRACSLEPPHGLGNRGGRASKIILNSAAGFFVVYIFLWNLSTLPNAPYNFPPKLAWVAALFRLDQAWNMFSPGPPHEDGWYVIPGTLADGRIIDVFKNGAPVNFAKPARVSSSYPDYRWQKYLMNMANSNYSAYRLYFGKYICRQWNERHSGLTTLENFEIFYVQEFTLSGGIKTAPQPISLWRHECL